MADLVRVVVENYATGETRTFSPLRTIGDVKSEIERNLAIPSQTQILAADGLNLLLYDNLVLNSIQSINLDSANLEPDDPTRTVILIHTKISSRKAVNIKIKLWYNTQGKELTFYSDETVLSMKRRFDRDYGVSPTRQCFYTLGAILSDDHQVCDFFIDDLPPPIQEIYVSRADITNPVQVSIDISGNFHTIPMDRMDTLYSLYGEVRRGGLVQQGRNFYFSLDDQRLEEGDMTFQDYNVNDILVLSYGTNFVSQIAETAGTGDDNQSYV